MRCRGTATMALWDKTDASSTPYEKTFPSKGMGGRACGIAPPLHPRATPRLMCKVKKAVSGHQILRDAPGFSHGEVSRCLRSRQSIWCSPQGWDTPGFSHGEEVTRLSRQDQSVSGRQTPPGGTFRTFLSPSPFLAHISPPRVRRFMGHSLLGCGPSGSQVISRWSFLYLS